MDKENQDPGQVEKDISSSNSASDGKNGSLVVAEVQESFWTRLGVSGNSFKRRHATGNEQRGNELQHKMKPRHLNMIAAGGAIGAGFFVGSGAALAIGVISSASPLGPFPGSTSQSL